MRQIGVASLTLKMTWQRNPVYLYAFIGLIYHNTIENCLKKRVGSNKTRLYTRRTRHNIEALVDFVVVWDAHILRTLLLEAVTR